MKPAEIAAAYERIEVEAWTAMHAALSSADRASLEIGVECRGGALSLMSPRFDTAMLNRTVGLGLDGPVSEATLDRLCASYAARGVPRWLLQWCPFAQPAAAPEWFDARGAKVVLPMARWWQPIRAESEEPSASDLSVVEIGPERRSLFGELVTSTTGIESELQPLVSACVGDARWRAYVVLRGGTAVAAAALFLSGAGAWLGLAGTLPSERNRGAQRMLIRRRLADARAMGCCWATSETPLASQDRPNTSFRNMEREGFRLAYVRETYLFGVRP